MILTDNKSIANLIGLDIIAEIADDYTFETAEFNAKYPVADRLQEAWVEAVEGGAGKQFEDTSLC